MKTNIDCCGKIPPQCVDIEEMILGSLLIEGQSIEKINIKPEYFYKGNHQKIFDAIKKLDLKNQVIDQLTVCEQLRKDNNLDDIGGPHYISTLTLKVASASHIENHCLILEDKFIKREFIRISSEIMDKSFDDTIDTQDVIDYANDSIDKISSVNNLSEFKNFSDVLKETINQLKIREKLFQEGKTIGIRTPVKKLTKYTGGWQKKDLVLIASRPSMGKTALALEVLKHAAEEGYNPCIFSLEMDAVRMANRIIIGDSGIDADSFKFGCINHEDWAALEKSLTRLLKLNITIEDRPVSINHIKNRARQLKKKGKCDLIVIDYLQLMSSDVKNTNREQEVASISRKCKLIAMELDLPVILLSQLNRDVEKRDDKRPQLSDLRESGAIEQDADIVMFIHRPEYYGITEDEQGNPLNGKSFLILAKNRDGRIGDIECRFNKSITEIYDWDDDYNPLTQEIDVNIRIESNKDFDNEGPF
jgi:replicative DNA helicase